MKMIVQISILAESRHYHEIGNAKLRLIKAGYVNQFRWNIDTWLSKRGIRRLNSLDLLASTCCWLHASRQWLWQVGITEKKAVFVFFKFLFAFIPGLVINGYQKSIIFKTKHTHKKMPFKAISQYSRHYCIVLGKN